MKTIQTLIPAKRTPCSSSSSSARLVLDQSAAPAPDLASVLDGQRWAVDFPAFDRIFEKKFKMTALRRS